MKNKKISLLAIGMLAIGAIGSMAYQSFAQTSKIAPIQPVVSTQVAPLEDQNIYQKDANGKDLETNDNTKSVTNIKKEGAKDNDSDIQSEQNENDFGQTEVGE